MQTDYFKPYDKKTTEIIKTCSHTFFFNIFVYLLETKTANLFLELFFLK